MNLWNKITLLGAETVLALTKLQITEFEGEVLLEKFSKFREYQNWLEEQAAKKAEAKAKRSR